MSQWVDSRLVVKGASLGSASAVQVRATNWRLAWAGWRETHSITMEMGLRSISSETTLVFRTIIAFISADLGRFSHWLSGRQLQFYTAKWLESRTDGACQVSAR